jgi:hypothetical protein
VDRTIQGETDATSIPIPRDAFIATGVLNVLESVRVGGAGRFSPAAVTSVPSVRHPVIPATVCNEK